jgi:hypothetical protein
MQLSQIFVVLAIAIASTSAVAINVDMNTRAVSASPLNSLESHSVYSRSALAARANETASIESQAVATQKTASSQYQAETAELKKLDVNTVTMEQLKPIIDRITATTKTAGDKFQSLSSQAKAAKNSKRQALLVPAVDQLVLDLNTVLQVVQPLVRHRESPGLRR